MTSSVPSAIPEVTPKLDQNILLFVRLLRAIGMKVGPASVVDAVEAAQLTGIDDKSIFFHGLSSCLVKSPQDRELFKQAFFPLLAKSEIPRADERFADSAI